MAAAIALCLPVTVSAQEAASGQDRPASMSVSIKEAQDYAVENNRTLANAALSVKQQRAARWQTIATLLPQASASLGYSNYFGYQIGLGEQMGGASIPMPSQGDVSVSVAWALNASSIVASIINTQAMEMADIQRQQTEQDVTSNVLVTYVSILVSEGNIDLLKRNLKNMEYLLQVSQNSTKVGVTEQVETDQIQVQVAQYKNSILTAERNREVLYNMLRLYMGLGVDTELALTQTLDEVLNMDEIMTILNSEINLADNYDYQVSKKNEEMAKKQIALKAMDYLPSITANYSYTAKKYFDGLGRDIEIIKLNGSIELAPILGMADVIVDIVETGKTLKENNLKVFESIFEISARLIANKASYNFKKDQISELVKRLNGEVNA